MNTTAMQNDGMTYRDIMAYHQRRAGRIKRTRMRYVQNGTILHIRARADPNAVNVAANDDAGPNRHLIPQFNVANKGSAVMDKDCVAQFGRDTSVDFYAHTMRIHTGNSSK
jgi:hypothetical protein